MTVEYTSNNFKKSNKGYNDSAGIESSHSASDTKRDDASIYSTNSTTSSMFSTASKLGRIPNAVKSSVKNLVRRNKKTSQSHYDLTSTANNTSDSSFTSKLKRSTMHFNIFSSKNKSQLPQEDIIPSPPSSSNSIYTPKRGSIDMLRKESASSDKTESYPLDNLNPLVPPTSCSSPVPYHKDSRHTNHSLFGKQSVDLEYLQSNSSPSDTKSEKMVSIKKDQNLWTRKRAKSCQEDKIPMLRQLASKGSFTKLSTVSTSNIPNTNIKKQAYNQDLPLFKGLVTTTLTTLHTRLINECDRTLSLIILPTNTPSTVSIRDQLLSIISDLYKMSEMVNWQTHEVIKSEVKDNIHTLEQSILIVELNIISVKDIVSTMKQIMNQCICQYYKVVEKAIVIPSKGYRIEGINKFGNNTSLSMIQRDDLIDYTSYGIDHKDPDAHWYRKYFFDHQNVITFMGCQQDQPTIISIKPEKIENKRFYRLIYRTKNDPDVRKLIPDSFLLNEPSQNTTQYIGDTIEDSTLKTIIETNIPELSFSHLLKINYDQMISSGIQNELLRLDENSLHTKYKFGVLFIKDGQTKEEDWFSNEHDSNSFERFLNIIGRRTKLKNYDGWAAGLDTRSGDSGEYTYTNVWNENIIAYHVSTLIPSKLGDKQQIQRKRHIGNDIVCIVFVEGNQPFNPTAIRSQFLHVFIVVHQEILNDTQVAWRVEIVSIEDVPVFGPPLPEKSAVFFNEQELEAYILAKLVNAEYAAFKSPKFSTPMNRAREGLFTNLVEKGCKLIQPEEIEIPTKKHTKSLSSVSSQSSNSTGAITPSTSKSSNVIREISENIAGLGRRKSTIDLLQSDKPKPTNITSNNNNTNSTVNTSNTNSNTQVKSPVTNSSSKSWWSKKS